MSWKEKAGEAAAEAAAKEAGRRAAETGCGCLAAGCASMVLLAVLPTYVLAKTVIHYLPF